jgi:glycerol-3-phosphate dehydrogenase
LQRDLTALARGDYDVLVIGGGIAGAFCAWDAAQRGLRTALIEARDFCGATSAYSLKVIHGGIRYLQHADIPRVIESCRERANLMRIAPHLTRPLPIVVPTEGRGMGGKLVFRAAFAVLEALTFGRNRNLPASQRIPAGRILSRSEALDTLPALEPEGLTGAALFCDGQVLDPPRLVLEIIRSAVRAGAVAANYCEATSLLIEDAAVRGARVVDRLSGQSFDLRAHCVVNAAGPYAEQLLVRAGVMPARKTPLSRDLALVLRRNLLGERGLAVQTKYRDPDAVFARGNRHLFLLPWRGHTLAGVSSRVWQGDPYELRVERDEVLAFLDEINEACPALALSPADVGCVYAGLLPFGDNAEGASHLSFGKRSLVVDHGLSGGPRGLVTAMSVRLTMGRAVAESAIDRVASLLGRRELPRCATAHSRVASGAFESLDGLRAEALAARPPALSERQLCALVSTYGCDYRAICERVAERPELAASLDPDCDAIAAQVVHAFRSEMAQSLADVVLRRSDLGLVGPPRAETLALCAELSAREAGWDDARVQKEIESVRGAFAWNPIP